MNIYKAEKTAFLAFLQVILIVEGGEIYENSNYRWIWYGEEYIR